MDRGAALGRGVASLPAPTPEPAPVEPGRRVTVAELARLWSTSPSQIDRMLRAGMPGLDLSCPRPGRRRKHLWRLDPEECAGWLRERQREARW